MSMGIRLKHVARINPPPSLVRHRNPDTLVSFVPMESVGEWGGLELDKTKPLGDIGSGYTYFEDGDVVVAKITPCFENGKGSLAAGLESGIGFGTSELHVIRPGPRIDARFLFYLTVSPHFRQRGEAEMYGAGGQKRVPTSYVADSRLPELSLHAQGAIADFLDRKTAAIDALIRKKERLIELLQEKRQALITQAVTKGLDPNVPMKDSGIEWLGEIPAHWEVLQLRRVVAQFVDYRGRTPEKATSGVPLITAGAIRDGYIAHDRAPEFVDYEVYEDLVKRGKPERGDLLFTSEAPLGEVGLVEDTTIACAQRIIMFKPHRQMMMSSFLRLHFLSSSGRGEVASRASGSTAAGIRADRLKMSLVPTPPLHEQMAIVEHVERAIHGMGSIFTTITEQIARLKEYRQALISAAVTGQLPIPEPEPTP